MLPLLQRRSSSHQFLCMLLITLTVAGPATTVAAQQPNARRTPVIEPRPVTLADPAKISDAPAGARYIAPGACVIFAVRPAQLLSSPAAEILPTEILQAASVKETGLDPLAAEEVVVSYSPPTSYALFARFNEKVQLKSGQLTAHTQPAAINGAEYLQSRELMAPSFYQPDPNSLLAAPDFIIKQLTATKSAPTPLVAKFAAESAHDDALLLVDMAALRPLINMAMKNTQTPPGFEELRTLPGLMKSIELRLNISRDAPTELVLTANNEADAQKLLDTTQALRDKAIAQMETQIREMEAQDDPVVKATAAYQRRMNRRMQESVQLERQGDRIILFNANLKTAGPNGMVAVATIGVRRPLAARGASRPRSGPPQCGAEQSEANHARDA